MAGYPSAKACATDLGIPVRKFQRWVEKSKHILGSVVDRTPLGRLNILHFDIEVYKFKFKDQYAYELKQGEKYYSYDEVEKDKAMICFAWAWQKKKDLVSLASVIDNHERFMNDHYDDYDLCVKLSELFSKADIAVAYNKKFDWKFFQWRCAVHKIVAPRKPFFFDPFAVVKSEWLATAKGLGPIAKNLGLTLKEHIPNQRRAAQGCPHTIIKTGDYNVADIPPMVQIFEYMVEMGWIRKGLNMKGFLNDKEVCLTCGSKDFRQDGIETTKTLQYENLRCKVCNTQQRGSRIK